MLNCIINQTQQGRKEREGGNGWMCSHHLGNVLVSPIDHVASIVAVCYDTIQRRGKCARARPLTPRAGLYVAVPQVPVYSAVCFFA